MSKIKETNLEVLQAESLAATVLRKIGEGKIERNINLKLSVKALPLIRQKNKNIIIIHDGELQYFIDKTNNEQIYELTRITEFKIRTATEELTHAQVALKQIKELK